MLSRWTIGRAIGFGAVSGLLTLVLWPFARLYESLAWPLLAAAAAAGLAGFSILAITAGDLIFHRRRGPRLRPVRAFDLVIGAGLLLLAFVQLRELAGQGLWLT
jgi:hypothetical protein